MVSTAESNGSAASIQRMIPFGSERILIAARLYSRVHVWLAAVETISAERSSVFSMVAGSASEDEDKRHSKSNGSVKFELAIESECRCRTRLLRACSMSATSR